MPEKQEGRANTTKRSVTDAFKGLGFSPAGIMAMLILGLMPVYITDNAFLRVMISSMMYGAFAMAFDFTSGFINITNFGYSAFWGIGAYTTAILMMHYGVNPWLGMLAGFLLAGVAGFGLGLLTIRLGGIFASCMTWFLALALFAVATNWVGLTEGSKGMSVDPLIASDSYTGIFYIMFAIVLIVYVVLMRVSNSNIGIAFRAIGQDTDAAQAAGIDPARYKLINFTISCALGGLIGAFYAHFSGIIIPKIFQTSNTVEIMALSYIGGRGSIWGGLLGAMLLLPVMDYMKGMMEWRLILYGLFMILAMIFYPAGLSGLINIVRGHIGRILHLSGKD
ncbi:branched-chain amino acid ABC transporter permease [Synergistales bacterium]|nr:branched-chain amino acid ABC transporter permease [Synergistales bacterium]